jgi:16S rRNA (guanine(966)-N(2))-methyltransferase RsmD
MSLRVIAGKAKGRRLRTVPGDSTRPILDRVKENLFNILGQWVTDTRWLDMFAGTGAVGIEALSRGAAYCLFLDLNRDAIRTIHTNLKDTKLADHAEVLRADSLALMSNTRRAGDGFDYVYVAPPQYLGMWRDALIALDRHPAWIVPDGVVVVQIDPSEYEEVTLDNLELFDQRTYGNTMLVFYEYPSR